MSEIQPKDTRIEIKYDEQGFKAGLSQLHEANHRLRSLISEATVQLEALERVEKEAVAIYIDGDSDVGATVVYVPTRLLSASRVIE